MTTFQVNETYKNNFIGDSNLYVSYKVIKRTAQFVTVEDIRTGETARCKVTEYDGNEVIYPMGRYSMAFTLRSNKKA
jgi:hypothetical protein